MYLAVAGSVVALSAAAIRNSPCVSAWYHRLESNQRPSGYESDALVN